MNQETQKALDELREYTLHADRSERIGDSYHGGSKIGGKNYRSEKTTWQDIALGIYVGGLALATTSALFWLLITAIFMASIRR